MAIPESWETANSQHPVTSNYARIVSRNPLRSRFRTIGEDEKKGTGQKRRKKNMSVLEEHNEDEGGRYSGGRVCVTESGLTFDAPLNKGSTHLVTHVTHTRICESSLDGFKDKTCTFVSHARKIGSSIFSQFPFNNQRC